MDSSQYNQMGRIRFEVLSSTRRRPVSNAHITITYTGGAANVIQDVQTDENGMTADIELQAPLLEYSMSPTDNQPYSEYNCRIEAEGYEEQFFSGIQIFSGETAIQKISLRPIANSADNYNPTVIPGHTLWEEYPEKIREAEIKPVNESGEIVLNQVVVPEYIVVHDGSPTDTTATDYYVLYKDYIKTVAACEIYSTWPEACIEANVLAIMSFTLNRVYTEWYRNQGYSFTITSSTAYDHKWTYGKSTYESIDAVVDRLFTSYLSRPNVKQPILTQYCDGKRVTCPNWMSQWGSKSLADQNYTASQILRYYYGDSIYINEATAVAGVPISWPGYLLEVGSEGEDVRIIQEQLNQIAKNYPAIPTLAVDGIYGAKTREAVLEFQKIFKIPQTGTVDYTTWYKISEIYVAVTRIAELQ
jgi:hypothetical protein